MGSAIEYVLKFFILSFLYHVFLGNTGTQDRQSLNISEAKQPYSL